MNPPGRVPATGLTGFLTLWTEIAPPLSICSFQTLK